MEQEKEHRNKKLCICLTPYEYSLLDAIREKHRKNISQLVRDSITFYSVYYPIPDTDKEI